MHPSDRAVARVSPVDLNYILERTHGLFGQLRNASVFITGGTGFFGRWMLESLIWANDCCGLDLKASVLTRTPAAFLEAFPHLATNRMVTLMAGDARDFDWPDDHYTHVLHLATETRANRDELLPHASFLTAISGTERILAFARERGVSHLLLTSSGAVYGRQPANCTHVSEDFAGAPDPCDANAGYAHGKRGAEYLCSVAAHEWGLQAKIARCFAFVGPYMPFARNFAIGNFIRDAVLGEAINVTSDGSAVRSYLYASDLVIWLWLVLLSGRAATPYNVGSDHPVSIGELAELVARVAGQDKQVRVAQERWPGVPPERYVPDVSRARRELGASIGVPLEEAIDRTSSWLRDSL